MSGGGGGTWIEQPKSSCEQLSEITALNSPNRAVLLNVQKGDVLDINVSNQNNVVVVQALFQGEIAGSITSAIIQRLAECVEQGFEYVAEVIENVVGGACKVRVRAK